MITRHLQNRKAIARLDEHINRLANALTFYRERMPHDPSLQHKHLIATARRFNVHQRLIVTALDIQRKGF